jgi:hypothetical protein
MAIEPRYEVVSPEGSVPRNDTIPAPPVADLGQVRIGELWDWLFKGDEIFRIVEDELRMRFPSITFTPYDVFGDIHSPGESEVVTKIPERLETTGCHAVISAVGA